MSLKVTIMHSSGFPGLRYAEPEDGGRQPEYHDPFIMIRVATGNGSNGHLALELGLDEIRELQQLLAAEEKWLVKATQEVNEARQTDEMKTEESK